MTLVLRKKGLHFVYHDSRVSRENLESGARPRRSGHASVNSPDDIQSVPKLYVEVEQEDARASSGPDEPTWALFAPPRKTEGATSGGRGNPRIEFLATLPSEENPRKLTLAVADCISRKHVAHHSVDGDPPVLEAFQMGGNRAPPSPAARPRRAPGSTNLRIRSDVRYPPEAAAFTKRGGAASLYRAPPGRPRPVTR